MDDRDSVLRGLAEISEYMKARADIADIVGVGKEKEIFDSWYRATEDAIDLLKTRQGEWIDRTDEQDPSGELTWKCSRCGEYTTDIRTRFCPECGARMEVSGE
ncbi:MAG: hypothetical protein IKS31_04995 [Clostridia bacterium]|nr:hypothetical protein [Clostridia bacterium]